MSAPETRVTSAPSSWRPRPPELPEPPGGRGGGGGVAEQDLKVPVESRNTQLPSFNTQMIPDELLISLTSTVCNRSALGHTAHQRQCQACGVRRPDAVWHHPLGRNKYRYFLEQPTSLSGAGRDISFLCDAAVTQRKSTPLPPLTDRKGSDSQEPSVSERLVPEEYHVVRNKGLRALELYEDAFTVQLQDDEHKLRVFPSLRPSGRQEAVQLMSVMDDMLEKAGVDQQREELTQLSQMEGLLELVQAEQNIYNIVFHEAIRQVSVGCAERGQLLAKLRQRYQSLLQQIPQRLKALHTEALAQRALDRRLTEEIHHIKDSFQQLSAELSSIRDHGVLVSQQTEHAHGQLTEELHQTQDHSDLVQGYHELYELQRGRLEAQLLQMTEERDSWSQMTFRLALKVVSLKKLQLVRRLHVHQQSWFQTAEDCILRLIAKDTADLSAVMELSDHWREQLVAFVSRMNTTEQTQVEEMKSVQRGIGYLTACCSARNQDSLTPALPTPQCPNPKDAQTTAENIYADIKEWKKVLTRLCERYEGEELFGRQQILEELGRVQEKWLSISRDLLRRHPPVDGGASQSERVQKDLVKVLPELLKQLDSRASGENGSYEKMTSLLGCMESWVSKLPSTIHQTDAAAASDWPGLEEELRVWHSLAGETLQNSFGVETKETERDESMNIHVETERLLDKVKEFVTDLSKFTDGENHKLNEEDPEEAPQWSGDVSLQTLDQDAKLLSAKLDSVSQRIARVYELKPHQAQSDTEMDECGKLQRECTDWTETCAILLSVVKEGRVELPDHTRKSPISASVSRETLIAVEDAEIPQQEMQQKESFKDEPTVTESPVVKFIDYDGNIAERKLGQTTLHPMGTGRAFVSPATGNAQKDLDDLTTVGLLQQELHDSELRVQSAERRALEAEEALQAALGKILDLERQLRGHCSLESEESKKTPPPSQPPAPPPPPAAAANPEPPKKTAPEAKRTSSSKKTKKR